jgi:hypothetical protein
MYWQMRESLKGRQILGKVAIDRKVILKCISKKYVVKV